MATQKHLVPPDVSKSTDRSSVGRDDFPNTDVLSWSFADPSKDIPNRSEDEDIIWQDCFDPTKNISYSTARRHVHRMIAGLKFNNVQFGDIVCVHATNSIWYPIIYLAIVGAGACFAGSNPAYKSTELVRVFEQTRPTLLLVEYAEVDKVLPCAMATGISPLQVFVIDAYHPEHPYQVSSLLWSAPCGWRSWRQLLDHGERDWITFDDRSRSLTTRAVCLFSSGTTGLAKTVVMSHHALVVQATMAESLEMHHTFQVRRLISLPFFHSFVLPFHLTALRRRHTTYVMPRFTAADFARFIDQYQITTMPSVPTLLHALLEDPAALTKPTKAFSRSTPCPRRFPSLRTIICAGAPLTGDVQARFAKALSEHASLIQLYGMSEVGWVTCASRSDGYGTVGRTFRGVEISLFRESLPVAAKDEVVGELLVRSPGRMIEYAHDREATEESFIDDQWFRTGDIGYHKGGKWYIIDRAKDMMKVRGWQVSPTEIEACLLQHEVVADVAVVGMQGDSVDGDIPVAFVVLRNTGQTPYQKLDLSDVAKELKMQVVSNLASYKAITGGVRFVEHIPRGPSGKLLRKQLRDSLLATTQSPPAA